MIWYLKFSSESKKTPKNFIAGTSSSFVTLLMALMLSAEFWSGLLLLQKISIFALVFVLEKSKNLVLSGWRTKRFMRKNSHTLRNSSLAIATSTSRFSCVKRSVVSSANNRARNLEDKLSWVELSWKKLYLPSSPQYICIQNYTIFNYINTVLYNIF